MRMELRRITRWAYAVVVAAGFGFGAQSALAAPAAASGCPNDPDRGQPGISCRVFSSECDGVCWYSGMWVDGFCSPDGCCQCPY